MKQTVYFGLGAVQRLGRVLDALRASRVFLVCGRRSFEMSGAAAAVEPALRHRQVYRFSDFTENPRLEDVARGAEIVRSQGFDVVVAVGGGSALDIAKLVNAVATQTAIPLDLVCGVAPIDAPVLPLVALPTTAGSGSEATHFAVVYVGDTKYSLASPRLLPGFAIVDPELTFSLPPTATAVSGIDAFCQAVESYWCIHSTPESQACARRAIAYALGHLQDAVNAPTPTARRFMSRAAHLAGRAINVTKTTAAHALSYPFTSHYAIPHGQAVCLTLGALLVYNSQVDDADTTDPRGAAHVRRAVGELVTMMGCDTAVQCRTRIEEMIQSIGLRTRISAFGLSCVDAADWVASHANVERMVNNPRALHDASVRQLLAEVC